MLLSDTEGSFDAANGRRKYSLNVSIYISHRLSDISSFLKIKTTKDFITT